MCTKYILWIFLTQRHAEFDTSTKYVFCFWTSQLLVYVMHSVCVPKVYFNYFFFIQSFQSNICFLKLGQQLDRISSIKHAVKNCSLVRPIYAPYIGYILPMYSYIGPSNIRTSIHACNKRICRRRSLVLRVNIQVCTMSGT